MAAQYKYDGAKNNKSGQCSTSYSQLKNTSNFNCDVGCLCSGNLNVRSSFDQMMYKQWVGPGENTDVYKNGVENYKKSGCDGCSTCLKNGK
jgi:hypothetical protein